MGKLPKVRGKCLPKPFILETLTTTRDTLPNKLNGGYSHTHFLASLTDYEVNPRLEGRNNGAHASNMEYWFRLRLIHVELDKEKGWDKYTGTAHNTMLTYFDSMLDYYGHMLKLDQQRGHHTPG